MKKEKFPHYIVLKFKKILLVLTIFIILIVNNSINLRQLCNDNIIIQNPNSSELVGFHCIINMGDVAEVELNESTVPISVSIPNDIQNDYTLIPTLLNITKDGNIINDSIEIEVIITKPEDNTIINSTIFSIYDKDTTLYYGIVGLNLKNETFPALFNISFIFNSTFYDIHEIINGTVVIQKSEFRFPPWFYFMISVSIGIIITIISLYGTRDRRLIKKKEKLENKKNRRINEIEKEKLIEEHEKILKDLENEQ